MDREYQKTIKQINELVQLLDAKINAVAAYVAEMPGASEVDVANVKKILATHQFTPSSISSIPSASSGVNRVLSGISEAAAAKKNGEAGSSNA